MKSISVAALITCHNRREKTIACLDALFSQDLDESWQLVVYVVDAGSTDGTAEAIKRRFPQVRLFCRDDSLYWCGGMRVAWAEAAKGDYDTYLWLNDDTMLLQNALLKLFADYNTINKSGNIGIIVGACCDVETNSFSYGGKVDNGPVIPNGEPQLCKYINGNCVLVPHKIFQIIGGLSEEFTHGIGDYDYGLRAINAGFSCWTTSEYVGNCGNNQLPAWCDQKTPLFKRLRLLYSPHGLNLKEYLAYRKRHWPRKWFVDLLKAHFRVLFINLYTYVKRKNR